MSSNAVFYIHQQVSFAPVPSPQSADLYIHQNLGYESSQNRDVTRFIHQNVTLYGSISAIGRAFGFVTPGKMALAFIFQNLGFELTDSPDGTRYTHQYIYEDATGQTRTTSDGTIRTTSDGTERTT